MFEEDYREVLDLNGYASYEEFERLHIEWGYSMDEIQICWNNLLKQHEEEKNELLRKAAKEQEEQRDQRFQMNITQGFR